MICPWLVSSPIHFRHCLCFSKAVTTIFTFLFFFFLFPITEKETKKLDKKELQRSRPTLARIFVGPTLATQQAFN
jgi:hypothetical protein